MRLRPTAARVRGLGAVLGACLALGLAPGVVGAQSASPATQSASPGPSASGSPAAHCTDLAAVLPTELADSQALTAEVGEGVAGFDPDDMLDPFLGSLGLDRDDVCSVGIRYGPAATTDLIGLLVRVRGAGPGLAAGLATALAERLREYGNEVTEEAVEGTTGPVTRLRIVASGEETLLLVADATSDSALLSASQALLEVLLPLLPEASPEPGASPVSSPVESMDAPVG
jgi:hypothetical protein